MEKVSSKAVAVGENLRVDQNGHMGQTESGSNLQLIGGLSPAWLGHQPPTLTTRVQIPETAPNSPRK